MAFLKTLPVIHNKRVCHIYNVTLGEDNSYILPPWSSQESRPWPVSQNFISPVETFKTLAKGWLIQFISVNSWLCPPLADNPLWFTSERVPIVCLNRVSTDSAFRLDQLSFGGSEYWMVCPKCGIVTTAAYLFYGDLLEYQQSSTGIMKCPAQSHSGLPYPVFSFHVTSCRIEINEYLIGQSLLVKVNWNTAKFHDTCMTITWDIFLN